MRLALPLLAITLLATPLAAQDSERPADWKVRFDRPAPDTALHFVSMAPGWHITTGPAAILYDPKQQAQGNYRVEAETHLFPGERLEGFGVFVGGDDLEGASQSYLYFLIRKDGSYLVKRRAGSETEVIVPWTTHDAIVKHDGGEGTAKNVLAIECGSDQVHFFVNGTMVNSLPRADLDVEGIVGLRVNHRLNIHVSSLEVAPAGR